MLEIDYNSKYLKYKQKYLKQKNLQIGGENVKINIIVKTINLIPPPNYNIVTFENVEINDSDNLGGNLYKFLESKGLNIEFFEVNTFTGNEYSIKNLLNSFKENTIKNGNTIIITEKIKIKINIIVKKIDKEKPDMYNRSFYENIPFNNTDLLYMVFRYLIDIGVLNGNLLTFRFQDFEIKCEEKPVELQKNFLENNILDKKTIIIKEKTRYV